MREALLGGFAQSRVLDVHGERVLKGNYKPGFRTKLYAKDLRNVMATLAEHDTPAPISAIVQQLVHATMAAGRGEDDNSIMGEDGHGARRALERLTTSRLIPHARSCPTLLPTVPARAGAPDRTRPPAAGCASR